MVRKLIREDAFGAYFSHDGERIRPEGPTRFEVGSAIDVKIAVGRLNVMRAIVVSTTSPRENETWTNVGPASRAREGED